MNNGTSEAIVVGGRKLFKGRRYRHFKGMNYMLLDVAEHTETQELFAIYKALYGEEKVYARPLDMFVSEVDKKKYPNTKQKYRLECIDNTNLIH